jgi:hypothetical protein
VPAVALRPCGLFENDVWLHAHCWRPLRTLLDRTERMMEAVHHYEGTVNQVMGDGIMALFGAPMAHEDHGVRACYGAIRMQDAVRRYSEELRRAQGVEVQIRVGLNSGDVVVRSIGSDLRMDYTAVGQTTNLAARMEQLAAPGGTRVTADTLHLAEGFVQATPLGPVPIKGLGEPVEVFAPPGGRPGDLHARAGRERGRRHRPPRQGVEAGPGPRLQPEALPSRLPGPPGPRGARALGRRAARVRLPPGDSAARRHRAPRRPRPMEGPRREGLPGGRPP